MGDQDSEAAAEEAAAEAANAAALRESKRNKNAEIEEDEEEDDEIEEGDPFANAQKFSEESSEAYWMDYEWKLPKNLWTQIYMYVSSQNTIFNKSNLIQPKILFENV